MDAEPKAWQIPPRAIVEGANEPTPALFQQRFESLAGLLRLALLSGMEQSLPTALHQLLDVAESVVKSDRQLVVYADQHDPKARFLLGRRFDPPSVPEVSDNLLHTWVGRAGKALVVERGLHPEMDVYLERTGARAAVAAPLFLEHDWAGSLQLFRTGDEPFTSADGHLLWILSLLAENQVARIRMVQRLTRMAYTDYLTGLRTRGYFEQALEQEVRRSLRKASSCGLLLIDLDNFKSVNDRYGHHAGDEVLRQFARILTRDMRDIDTVARFGGDEFSIILPDTSPEGARFVATRVRDAVRAHHFTLPDIDLKMPLSLSCGIALCPEDESSPDQLLRAADLALYQAKQRGKDRPFYSGDRRAG